MRRLVLAQLLTLAGLWCAAMVFFAHDAARNDDRYRPELLARRADMVLGVADALADRPQALRETLQRIDRVQRGEGGEEDHPATRITMSVWLGGEPVFASPGPPGALRGRQLDVLERVDVQGVERRSYTRVSPASGARVTLAQAGDLPLMLTSMLSRGLLVLPLLVSLPLLLVPAWLSVRLALRPWRQLAREVESRAPGDLAPLRFQARHRELQPLTRAIDQLLQRVRDGVQRERSFIADAAHELRTPLAAMRIHVEALQQRPMDERERHLLEGLARSGERANRLVRQLLTLMRSDARQARPEVLSLAALVQERLAELSPLALERDVELEFCGACEAWLRGERESLGSLLDNLVENAIKYSPVGGTVRVGVREDAKGMELSVEDEGPGIAPAYRGRVFDRFFRLPDQSQPGSGLGLAIVRSAAERHGARVSVEDREQGGGLRVRVVFPAARQAAGRDAPLARHGYQN